MGQDGWYLAETLHKQGYEVVGTTHRPQAAGSMRIGDDEVPVVQLDITNTNDIEDMIRDRHFDEVYNLAARASSDELFDDALTSSDVNGVAVARFLEAIRRYSPTTRFCQASSSEVFAGSPGSPQDETTPRIPLNAYGATKAFGDHLVRAYRHAFGLFACSAVLYTHESPRRSPHFLMRKVSMAVAQIAAGLAESVPLRDLRSRRDWGFAPDYVEAMRRMLQAEEPRDYVIATGEAHTVQDVCETAFGHVGLDWQHHVSVTPDPGYPQEENLRIGDASRARADLGWAPTVGFIELVTLMVDADRSMINTRRSSNPSGHVFTD